MNQTRSARPYAPRFTVDIGDSVISIACTPNGSLIVAGAVDRCVHGFGRDGERRFEKHRLDHEVWAISVSADGSRIAAGTANKKPSEGSVHILDNRGKPLWNTQIGAPVWAVSLSADGRTLAASAWDGYVYMFSEDTEGWKLKVKTKIGNAGAYGVSLSDDGSAVAAIAYADSLKYLNSDLAETGRIADENFGYRVRLTGDGKYAIAGMRNGAVCLAELSGGTQTKISKLSQRPICGVGITPSAKLCATGGFDGQFRLLNSELELLWSFRTEGEVWAVDLSYDGRIACIASGDGRIYVLDNFITDAALEEIGLLESRVLLSKNWTEKSSVLSYLIEHYAHYGLDEYGLSKLEEWRRGKKIDDGQALAASTNLLQEISKQDSSNVRARFLLAGLYEERHEYWKAGLEYVYAARDSNLRQRAFTAAARCFKNSNHLAAAISCFRRVREQALHEDDLRVLYNLARSQEDLGNFESARDYYDILLIWEPNYRDVKERSQSLDHGNLNFGSRARGEVDYTGLTVNVLNPDMPRYGDVDPSLHAVIDARNKELYVSAEERKRFETVFKKYYREDGIREKTRTELGYGIESYIKYDFLLPEDEIKKELERINTLALLEGGPSIARSLDIGAATGRWPRTFASQGIEAYGIDIEENAIKYANTKLTDDDLKRGFPNLRVGNALALPYEEGFFCLTTCMMGTFAHIERRDHQKFFTEAVKVLRPGGLLLISTWDPECRHQSYLSMYNFNEKLMIDRNSLTRSQLVEAGISAGLLVEQQVPICLVPDVLSFELGIKDLDGESLRQMHNIDIAARSIFPEMHGQMFLTLFRKPG